MREIPSVVLVIQSGQSQSAMSVLVVSLEWKETFVRVTMWNSRHSVDWLDGFRQGPEQLGLAEDQFQEEFDAIDTNHRGFILFDEVRSLFPSYRSIVLIFCSRLVLYSSKRLSITENVCCRWPGWCFPIRKRKEFDFVSGLIIFLKNDLGKLISTSVQRGPMLLFETEETFVDSWTPQHDVRPILSFSWIVLLSLSLLNRVLFSLLVSYFLVKLTTGREWVQHANGIVAEGRK